MVAGTLNSLPDESFLIQFFANDERDPSGFGEGRTWVGQTMVATDADGNALIDFPISVQLPAGTFLSATATLIAGQSFVETSEFSETVTVEAIGPIIVATKEDSLAVDANSDGQADPGDVIGYTIQIDNSGDGDARDVRFSDTLDPNTTLVTDSLMVTPLALDDIYSVVPDMSITVDAASGLLANDFDIDGTAPGTNADLTMVVGSVSRVDGVSDVTGTFAPSSDGSFTYTPPFGARGTEVFAYNILDADGLGALVPGFVTFDVTSHIWFVDNSRTTNGDGSLTSPFNSFSDLNGSGGAGDVDRPGDTIFVFTGSEDYDEAAPIELEDHQQLIGEGVGLANFSIPPNATPPTLTNTSSGFGEAILLADDNLISGFDISNTFGSAVQGNGSDGGRIESVTINTPSGAGVDLRDATGTLVLSGVTIVDAMQAGLLVDGGDVTVQVGLTDPSHIQASTRPAVRVSGGHTGSINLHFTSDISATDGGGLRFDNANGIYDFNAPVTISGGDVGIEILNSPAGSFQFNELDIDNIDGNGVHAANSGSISIVNSEIDGTTANAISNTNTGLTVDFTNIGANAPVGDDGIELIDNDDVVLRIASITNSNIGIGNPIGNRGIFINSSGTGTLIANLSGNAISSTNQTILTNDDGVAGSLVLDMQNSTLTTNAAGTFTQEHVGSGLNSTIVRSWSGPNQVIGSPIGSGGISFDRVTFDSSGTDLLGTQLVFRGTSTLQIGSVAARVLGDGLSLMGTSGSLSIPTLNVFNSGGVGLHADTTGTAFAFEASGGMIDSLGGEGIWATNFMRATISNTQVTGGDGVSAVEVILNEDGLASSITTLDNTWTARSGNADGVVISTSETATLCLDAVGNQNTGSGSGFGLVLNQTDPSVLGITQSDAAEFASDNPLTPPPMVTGTITFGCVPPTAAPLMSTSIASPSTAAEPASEGEILPSMPLVIGTLPAGKAIEVVFQAEINDPLPAGVTQVSNQGTVSGSNFVDVLTDDPATTGPMIQQSRPSKSSLRRWPICRSISKSTNPRPNRARPCRSS